MTAADFEPSTADARRPLARIRGQKFHLQPLRALKAVQRLIRDKDDTESVFDLMQALSGTSIPRGYLRLLGTPEGGAAAYAMEEFADRVADQAWLDSFAPGTVGATYRDFIAARGISAEGLADESRKVMDGDVDAAHPMAWYGRRLRDIHDVWHVLTGYETDALGESCVVAFSYPQTRSLGFAVIAIAAANEYRKVRNGQPYMEAIREGWANGRKARWLPAVDYPALFAETLDGARARLRIATPVIYRSIPPELRDAGANAMAQA